MMKKCFYFRKKLAYCANCAEQLENCNVILTIKEDSLEYRHGQKKDLQCIAIDSPREIPEYETYAKVIQIVCSACQKKAKGVQK